MDQPAAEYETKKEAEASKGDLVTFWLDAIAASSKEEEDWREEAGEVVEIYRGDCDEGQDEFNIVYSNIETLLPAIYNSTPTPDVRRRFNDRDPVGKTVCDLLERTITHSTDSYDFDAVMNGAIFDGTLAGRGVARARYMPEVDDTGKEYQAVTTEYVPWQNFRRGAGRTWDDVPWIAFEHFLSRDELKKLNPELADKVKMDCKSGDSGDKDDSDDPQKEGGDIFARARVWEIWDKEAKELIFIATGYTDGPLRSEPDPLKLKGFFPAPRPIQPINTAGNLVPVTSYRAYRKLAEELNDITRRIKKLIKQLRVRGGYAAGNADLESITRADDGELVPMQGLEALMDGGIDKAVMWWPMDPTVKALQSLYQQRDMVKQTIYEVTGISDIVRGASAASETATAQQIKQQWGSLRIQRMQFEVQRFARDLFRIKAEIIATFFEPQVLSEITGIKLYPQAMIQQAQMALQQAQQPPQPGMPTAPPPPPEAQEVADGAALEPVMQIMRNDILRGCRIDIESDSTIRADLTRNQRTMSDFLQGTAQYLAAVGPAVQAGQMPPEVAVEIYTSFARNFKLGKQAEDALDKMGDDARKSAKQPKPQKPDPEMAKVQAQAQIEQQRLAMEGQLKAKEAELKQAELQHKQATAQADLVLQQQKAAAEIELKRQIEEIKLQIEIQKSQHEMQVKQQMAEQDHMLRKDKQSSDIRMGRERQILDYKAKGVKAQAAGGEDGDGPDAETASDTEITDPMQEAFAPVAAAMQQVAEAMAAMVQQQAQSQQQMMALLAAPKKIVRGANGQVDGVAIDVSNLN